MPMTPAEARSVERRPVVVGESYVFYAEMQQEYEPAEGRMRNYTGKLVTVVRNLTTEEYDGPGPDDANDDDFDVSRAFIVRCALDRREFTAMVEELNGWDRDLGQYFWPDATYGPAHERWALSNERSN